MMERVELNGELLFTLQNKQDWVNKCPGIIPPKKYYGEEFIFVDTNGNILKMGMDFMAAEKQKTYPVKVYRLKRTSDK